MSTLLALRAAVIDKSKDSSGAISSADYDRNILDAIKRFSRHRPNIKVVDVTGNGTSDYTLPTGWIDEFSSISSIEYPVGDNPETLLESDEYKIYQSPTAKKIRLLNITPAATETFRVAFTILRTDTTIPAADEDALCNLAAALCLEDLANVYAQTSDPTISADAVNYRSKSYEFGQRAKRLMQLYKEHMGIKEDDLTPAAAAIADYDMKYPGGGERLTHPRRQREER